MHCWTIFLKSVYVFQKKKTVYRKILSFFSNYVIFQMSSEFEKTAIENSDVNFICCLPSLGITAFITTILTSIYREVVRRKKHLKNLVFNIFHANKYTGTVIHPSQFTQIHSLRSFHPKHSLTAIHPVYFHIKFTHFNVTISLQ